METLARFKTRSYRGRDDLAGMVAVYNARVEEDGGDDFVTVEGMAQQYQHLQRCDPESDILVVEDEGGTIVGYARTTWDDVSEGYRIYWVVANGLSRHPDLEPELYAWAEERAGQVAAGHSVIDQRLGAWADEDTTRAAMLRRLGYVAVRYGADMVRPHLDDVPHLPLPDGIEVRPVQEAQLRTIWEADIEAFRDHRGYVEQTEEDWRAWLDTPHWDPTLWQVAWEGDRVVGQVRSFIDQTENQRLGRRRGYTEDISTARDRRRMGIASSLICSSLRLLRQRGMEDAGLGVDTGNPTGALRLYESLGFVRTRLNAEYEKPV